MTFKPTSHGALMDRVYRRQRHIYDFTRKYYLFGRDRLIGRLDLQQGARAVEIGCGTARNLIAIARRYPGVRLFGLDASQSMLETANRAVARAGFSDRIVLVHGYAEQLSPGLFGESQPFDCAIFSYSLSMIPDWRGAMRAANAGLAEDGRLHIVDFGDLAGLGRIGAGILRMWLRAFHVEPRSEILRTLENSGAMRAAGQFWISPGRYAFVWSTGRLWDAPLSNVAGQPQPLGNSR